MQKQKEKKQSEARSKVIYLLRHSLRFAYIFRNFDERTNKQRHQTTTTKLVIAYYEFGMDSKFESQLYETDSHNASAYGSAKPKKDTEKRHAV